MSEEDKERPVVYFDGDCPMCRAFVPLIDQPEKSDSAKFENLRTANLPEGIKLEEATKKIHIVTKNGEILSGAKAVFSALEANNKYLWLVRLGRLPLIDNLAEVVYTIIAKNRFLLFDPSRRWLKRGLIFAFMLFIIWLLM